MNCSKDDVGLINSRDFVGPIDCIGGGDRVVYAIMDGWVTMERLRSVGCPVVSTAEIVILGPLSVTVEIVDGSFKSDEGKRGLEVLENLLERGEFALEWRAPGIGYTCDSCEDLQQYCGFNGTTNQTFCFRPHVRGTCLHFMFLWFPFAGKFCNGLTGLV